MKIKKKHKVIIYIIKTQKKMITMKILIILKIYKNSKKIKNKLQSNKVGKTNWTIWSTIPISKSDQMKLFI